MEGKTTAAAQGEGLRRSKMTDDFWATLKAQNEAAPQS